MAPSLDVAPLHEGRGVGDDPVPPAAALLVIVVVVVVAAPRGDRHLRLRPHCPPHGPRPGTVRKLSAKKSAELEICKRRYELDTEML